MTEADKPHEHDESNHAPTAADPHPAPEASSDANAKVEPEGHADGAPAADASADSEAGAAEPRHPAEVADDAPVAHEVTAEPSHEPEPVPTQPAEPLAAAAFAGSTAAVAGRVDAGSPIWSDHGDARDHATPKPIYKERKTKKSSSSGGSGNEFVEILKTVFFALLIAVVLRIVLFQPFTIPSASMEPNLYEGDYIVVSKWSYGYSKHAIPFSPDLFEGRILGKAPQRGDIAVFKLPRDNKTDYIKRVIGLPGDRVQMIDGTLNINGEPVRDVIIDPREVTQVLGARPATQLRETLPNGRTFAIQDFGPGGMLDGTPVFEVPEGHYFMMGDNRDNSIDSRDQSSQGVGLVPEENLIGKAEIILFSWSPGASLFNPISWFSKVRFSRFFTDLD